MKVTDLLILTAQQLHPVTSISAGMIDKLAEKIIFGANTKKILKNALKGMKKLTSITCVKGTKFGKNSLKGTSKKLVIALTLPKGSTKKQVSKAIKALEKQLKNAGNSKAKVEAVIED